MFSKTQDPLKVSTYILALALSSTGMAKGLDQLQAEPNKPADSTLTAPTSTTTPPSDTVPGANSLQPAVQTQAPGPVASATGEVERMYLASSFSLISLSADKGDWVSGATADLEAGYRFMTLMQKFDLFGTFRYRPVEITVKADQREYRGIVESYLFGAKGRMALNSKLAINASAELGASQTHLNSIDTLPNVDQSLEKSGVDLSLGGGVSYLVLDKLAVGTRLALGTGAFKTIQFGFDLRFLL